MRRAKLDYNFNHTMKITYKKVSVWYDKLNRMNESYVEMYRTRNIVGACLRSQLEIAADIITRAIGFDRYNKALSPIPANQPGQPTRLRRRPILLDSILMKIPVLWNGSVRYI